MGDETRRRKKAGYTFLLRLILHPSFAVATTPGACYGNRMPAGDSFQLATGESRSFRQALHFLGRAALLRCPVCGTRPIFLPVRRVRTVDDWFDGDSDDDDGIGLLPAAPAGGTGGIVPGGGDDGQPYDDGHGEGAGVGAGRELVGAGR